MSSILKNTRKIFTGVGGDPSLDPRITNLENNEYKILYFETISAATGTISKPTGSTILLDQFYSGGDAIVETLSNGQPTGQSPLTVGGSVVSVSSFDASGNYTLSGTPSSFPVALVYIFKIKAIDYVNLTIDNIMSMEQNDFELSSNKQNSLATDGTGNKYPTIDAINAGVWTKQVIQITSSTAPTVNTTGYRRTFVDITALAGNINLSTNLTGTPQNGDVLIYQIKDNGTARTITTESNIESKGDSVPATTVISKRVNIGFTWDSTTSKWGCISVAQES